jgi:hypothetical protein
MIHYWRQIWNQRTNGITDIQFPFGFVQVSFPVDHYKYLTIQTDKTNVCVIYSYPQIGMILRELAVSHGFDGIKHLMLVMFRTMSFQKSSWLSLSIYVMILMGDWIFSVYHLELFIFSGVILDINMMLVIDFHALVLQWLMDNK